MKTPLATVIVPVKNMSGRMNNMSTWLQQVENFPIEIILVNDNSTDSTFTELTELKKQFDPLRIQLISGEFFGPGGARNAGLSLAQGEWVVFWDSDDTPFPSAFFEMIKSAATRDLDYAVGNWIASPNSNSKGATVRTSAHGTGLLELIKYPGIWRWAFKRSAVGNIRFPSVLLGEDLVFLSKLQIRLSRVYRYSKPVYAYSIGNDTQLTSKKSIRKNSDALHQYLNSIDFFIGKVTFFGFLIKAKLLVSTIIRNDKK
jgi:glycosyltransferase involved in cell wall biosynthesis